MTDGQKSIQAERSNAPTPMLMRLPHWLRTCPRTSLRCRELGHNWKPWLVSFQKTWGGYQRTLRCPRCKTHRVQELHKKGTVSHAGGCAQGGTDTCTDRQARPIQWSLRHGSDGALLASCDYHLLNFLRNQKRNARRSGQ